MTSQQVISVPTMGMALVTHLHYLPTCLPSFLPAGASRQSQSGPEKVHEAAEKEYYSKDGVERVRHVSTKGSGLTTTLFSILYLYRRA